MPTLITAATIRVEFTSVSSAEWATRRVSTRTLITAQFSRRAFALGLLNAPTALPNRPMWTAGISSVEVAGCTDTNRFGENLTSARSSVQL